jgi:hypothetical protein
MLIGDSCRGRSKNEGAFAGASAGLSIEALEADAPAVISDLLMLWSALERADEGARVELKCERFPCPRLKAFFASVCLRKASKSGLASNGICLGDCGLKDRIDDVGGLQLSFGPTPESLGSSSELIVSPK